jgi:dihydrodipicolinate synthase/N-acetylneuraminate lyase
MKRVDFLSSPVYPVPPSFNDDGTLDMKGIENYLEFLESKGVENVMTTAGTSQFNLMSSGEILAFNRKVSESSIKNKIIGIPESSPWETFSSIEEYSKVTNSSLMILFPERHYTDDEVVDFFERCSLCTTNPLLVHGMWLRSSKGGNWDYTSEVIDAISSIENFVGMKEETSEIGKSFGIIESIKNPEFQVILAGGSQKRHWFSGLNRKCTFLSGVGSIWPEVDKMYLDFYTSNNLESAKEIIHKFESPLFKVFMKHGWHYSMRKALSMKGLIKNNRLPFPKTLGKEVDLEIEKISIYIDSLLENE